MAETSNIAWTDATVNFWIGCTEAGPGCDFCYARELDRRYQFGESPMTADQNRSIKRAPHWGIGAPRYFPNPDKKLAEVARWNRKAEAAGKVVKVFCNSLSDIFDNEVRAPQREVAFTAWRNSPWLRWIVLTKRVPNIEKMLPSDWGAGYPNVGLVATTVTQDEFDRDAPRLLKIPAAWHGFSMEPQLEEITLPGWLTDHPGSLWFITGGESRQAVAGERNGGERPYDPMWAYTLTHAALTGRSMRKSWWTFVKQMGCKPVGLIPAKDGAGADPKEWPHQIRVRDFPPELLT